MIGGGGHTTAIFDSGEILGMHYKRQLDPKAIPQFGLVAEEVEKVRPDLVIRDAQRKAYCVRYGAVNAMLLNESLKEHDKVSRLEASNARLEATVAAQSKTFAQQQEVIRNLTASLKQQAALLQKVSAQVQANSPLPRMAAANN